MNIIQLTPGAGGMYCGVCIRDNALVAALRKLGHRVTMVPLYLPLTLDEKDESAETPVFFSGINVYLDQKSGLFAKAPEWFRRLFASRGLLKHVGSMAAKTRPSQLGDLTLSMLKGEEGRQARDLDELINWLKSQPKCDVVFLSNALLMGMVRKLRAELNVPIVCMFQGEDFFLDALPQPHRDQCWKELALRAKEVDVLAAPSRYFADLMAGRLGLDKESIRVAPNGINLEGFSLLPERKAATNENLTLGYFARMCPEKGLDTLVAAFIELKKRDKLRHLKLKIGGSCGPADEPFVRILRHRLSNNDVLKDVEFHPNLSHAQKVAFISSVTVLSVPTRFPEAFGLFLIEAFAAGVPVVQPDIGAFPELIGETSGGLVYDPKDPKDLPNTLAALLEDPKQANALGAIARRVVMQKYNAEAMAKTMVGLCQRT